MTNEVKCKHYDEENEWCKKLSDWSDPMPHIVYCPKSPCEHAEPIKQPMNDNDIIKALECCGNQMYSCTDKRCKAKTLGEAHDLINRQKAEIERLTKRLEEEKHALFEQQAYTVKLQAENDEFREIIFTDRSEAIKTLKAEAIKEFAERLKSIRKGCSFTFYSNRHFCESIDNLVKEMTEEQEQ